MGEQLSIREVDEHIEALRIRAAEQLGQDALELTSV
jgi:plasmid stability protein